MGGGGERGRESKRARKTRTSTIYVASFDIFIHLLQELHACGPEKQGAVHED
jgi:hypothetical protein